MRFAWSTRTYELPLSKVKKGMAEVLKREGYIWDFEEVGMSRNGNSACT